MAVSYSKDASIAQALEKTFDGHHLCKLCKIVRAGKKAEDRNDVKMDLSKLDLIVDVPQFFIFHSPSIIPQSGFTVLLQRTEAPLLPPPLFA